MVWIPKGKDIRTRYGCKCKNKYKSAASGKAYKDSCNLEGQNEPWCMVQGKCGIREIVGWGSTGVHKGRYWDNCIDDYRSFLDSKVKYGKNYFLYNFIGIALFYIIFVFAIPYFLYKNKYNDILEVYLPNFDLLATAVSFNGGPYWTKRVFNELYNPASKNWMGFISTLMINYMALMGVVYLVAMHAKKSRSIATGLGVGLVMIFLTYLLPNQIIAAMQLHSARWVRKPLGFSGRDGPFMYIIISLIGLGVATLFILAEMAVLARHKTFIDPITKQIVQLAQGRF